MARLMRVLLVINGLPPAATGGTEIYTHQFAAALSELPDLEVFVLTRDVDCGRPEYSVRQDATLTGVTVWCINDTFQAHSSFEDSYKNPALARVAARIIDHEIVPDVVHIQHLSGLSTGIVSHASMKRTPVVMTLNDYWLLCHRGDLLRPDGTRCEGPFDGGCASCVPACVVADRTASPASELAHGVAPSAAAALVGAASGSRTRGLSLQQLGAASAARLDHLRGISSGIDLFLAPSATMEAWVARLPIECWRLFRCEHGIDLRPFAQAVRRPSDTLRLAFAGRLTVAEAPHLLLEAVAALPPGCVTVDVLGVPDAAGNRQYAERLKPLLRQPIVRKLGHVPHEQMADALSDVDALVVPSIWIQNAPFVIREAFAAGLPVLASNLGGLAEMVRHDDNGLLFVPGSAAALAEQILRLLNEPDLMHHLKRNVRPPMSIQEDAGKMRERYERLLWTPGAQETA